MEETTLPTQEPTHEVTIASESSGKNEAGASADGKESLELADELTEKGVKASKAGDYAEAVDCYSRALEIRVAHHGELSPECVNAFYKYGCALLYKAQEETDPIGGGLKKDAKSPIDCDKDGSTKNVAAGESSVASASNTDVLEKNSNEEGSVAENDSNGKDKEDEGDESDNEDVDEGDEDESDLELAWKMLDLARAIAEKTPGDTLEKVDILSALAEVSLEREDLETSLTDYQNALAILERIAEPDSRYIAELNFRISLCFEFGSKYSEAIPFCKKAISICTSRVQRLTEELKNMPEAEPTSVAAEEANLPSNGDGSANAVSKKQTEIETLNDLLGELEKKLEDLQQLLMNPTSILSDILLGMVSAKAASNGDKGAPSVSAASNSKAPTVPTAHTNGNSVVTDLGVVGRGIKRVTPTSITVESNPTKKPALDPSGNQGEGGSA